MTVLVNSTGTRRCDESCHNAKHMKCNCICGGLLHGMGEEYALAHAEEVAKKRKAVSTDLDDEYDEDAVAAEDSLAEELEDEEEVDPTNYDECDACVKYGECEKSYTYVKGQHCDDFEAMVEPTEP